MPPPSGKEEKVIPRTPRKKSADTASSSTTPPPRPTATPKKPPRARKKPTEHLPPTTTSITTQLAALKLTKQTRGQFYSREANYILQHITIPPNTTHVIEPFAGKGDLVVWARTAHQYRGQLDAYDIQPNATNCTVHCPITTQDTLTTPPDYSNKWVLTNPPYLARNKTEDKTLFTLYDTNDLFKCFILSLCNLPATPLNSTRSLPSGGALILPATFFLSPRDLDRKVRNEFMSRFRILNVSYFEEQTFPDTTITVVAFQFERNPDPTHPLTTQEVIWRRMPNPNNSPENLKIFHMRADQGWIIGGDIYHLTPIPPFSSVHIGRQVTGTPLKPNTQLTRMLLCAMDSGKQDGRIRLEFKPAEFTYDSKHTSRSYALLTCTGATLTPDQQQTLCTRFNEFIEQKRTETWSLFLPQFRESKEYARKRIPFDLAYDVVLHLMSTLAPGAGSIKVSEAKK